MPIEKHNNEKDLEKFESVADLQEKENKQKKEDNVRIDRYGRRFVVNRLGIVIYL